MKLALTLGLNAATNQTGLLPDPAASIDSVYGAGTGDSDRQYSGTTALLSETIDWMQVSARFSIESWSANDTFISSAVTSTSRFWMYTPTGTGLRIYTGASGDRIDIASASTNLPTGTEITMHIFIDYTQTNENTQFRIYFEWDGGSWTPTIASAARSATTPNIATLFTAGLYVGGGTDSTTRADMAHTAYLVRWGMGSTPSVPTWSNAVFDWNADWGDNGENVWGQPQLYYAGTLDEWNGSLPNRGDYGTLPMRPKLINTETDELTTDYELAA